MTKKEYAKRSKIDESNKPSNKYPLTRFDPGKLPDPPEHLNTAASVWWWKIAAWAKVRNSFVDVPLERLEDIAVLLARYDNNGHEADLININNQLAECGFCRVDLKHLDIEVLDNFNQIEDTDGEADKTDKKDGEAPRV